MFLEEIVDGTEFENDSTECKALLNRDDVMGWLKTIAGFADASGGKLFIGVEDVSLNEISSLNSIPEK